LEGVVCGVESPERHAAVPRRHVKRVEQVLDGDRNAQQCPLRTSPASDVSRPRLFNRVALDDLVCVEAKLPLVVDFDPIELRLRDFLRGRDARHHVGAQFGDGLADHVVPGAARWLLG
jgi:hypothetical protein